MMAHEKPFLIWQNPRIVAVVLFHIFCCLNCGAEGFKDGLYSTDTDFVWPLNESTFQNQVINSRPGLIWAVEFYNSWCGHCIHFAPTWKKLAEELKEWSDIVVIAGIDCSQSINVKTCRQFDIQAYPTMKLFPPADTPGRLEKVAPIKSQDLEKIKSAILAFMTDFAFESWPRLKPLDKMEDMWKLKGAQDAQLFIVFEAEKSVVGRQVVLDLRNISGIMVLTMLEDKASEAGITEFPSLYKINPDATYSKLAVGKNLPASDRLMFVESIKQEVKSSQVIMIPPEKKSEGLGVKDRAPSTFDKNRFKAKLSRNQVNMQDLESALHYSLRQEVAICKTVDGEKLDALKDYITVLKKYFPGRESVQRFLVQVWEMLLSLKTQSLTGEEWVELLDDVQSESQYLPEVIRWASCQGSSPQYRGFPCSMWTLFHTLTVGAYTQNTGPRPGNPREVLVAIQGYMKYFFGCDECSKHFLEMAQNVETEVSSHASSVLWLWSRHNQVNSRLSGHDSEDPHFPKVQFPSHTLCPDCKVRGSTEWDEKKVLAFLAGFYSEAEIFLPDDLQTYQIEDSPGQGVNNGKGSIALLDKNKELDWWEKKQREMDLKQIQVLRDRKRGGKKQDSDLALASNVRTQKHSPSEGEKNVIDIAQSRSNQLKHSMRALWGLTQLDLSMCVVFYIISTLIILMLYHHFIIRRHMNPCRSAKAGTLAL